MKVFDLRIHAVLPVFLLFGGLLYGQQTSGNIQGTVYDQSGATVPGAAVVATNIATGAENQTVSTSAGEYRIQNLLAGKYTIAVDASGFAKSRVDDITVDINQTVTANVTLQIGQTATTVEVNTSAANIEIGRAHV